MNEILFFSNNKNKIIEVTNLFNNSPIRVLSLNDFDKINSPNETGNSFRKNSKIKSLYGYKKIGKICFADDSGICINALNGKPGINSKKFLLSKKNPIDVLKEIISITKKTKEFNAEFQTHICLTINTSKHFFFRGTIKGKISKKIKGVLGFGYDPIFIPAGKKITLAEMTLEEKNFISHRAIAINKLKRYVLNYFN